jgi:photosystem II stability/assembly factor-like uncharacterized protein
MPQLFLAIATVVVALGASSGVAGSATPAPIVGQSKAVVVDGSHSGALGSVALNELECATAQYCVGVHQPLATKSSVAITANGGATWTVRTIDAQIFNLQCPTRSRCVASGFKVPDSGSEQTFISSDGGRSWSEYKTAGADPAILICTSSSHCLAEVIGPSSGPHFAVTTDAGVTWRQSGPQLQTAVDPAISCPTTNWCMAAGTDAAGAGEFDVSTDGGASWHHVTSTLSPLPNQLACYSRDDCIVIADPGTDSVPFSSSASVFRTADGGETWQRSSSALEDPQAFLTCSPGGQTCVDPASKGKVYVSHDGGASWKLVAVGASFSPSSITCPSSATCYTTNDSIGLPVFETVDGGATWHQLL